MREDNMEVLPEVSGIQAVCYDYFPTVWQMVIWRNWGYVPAERLAEILQMSQKKVREEAAFMGLDPRIEADPVWEKRGYLTLIRNNWHLLSYRQLLILLHMTAQQLAFTLKEDDFLWVKLGFMKPEVKEPVYVTLTENQREQTLEIRRSIERSFPHGCERADNAFEFLEAFYRPLLESEHKAGERKAEGQALRMVYPYFALYGDVWIDETIDPLPERLLMEYAKAGINGIWMQCVLYQMVEFPFDPAMSNGWEKRIRSLRRLVEQAKKYGIGVYVYLNEPRSMTEAFFKKYPQLKGEREGDFYSMCTSTQEVKEYLYQSVKKLFTEVPDLAGFFSISMSENLTNCYSRLTNQECSCPRCRERKPWEVVAEVNNLMAKGAHDAASSAKAIVWTWGWQDEWAEKAIPLLTEGQILQCTSEEAMEYCIGGVKGKVWDYTMSLIGPGEKAKSMWKAAKGHGLEISAKVQVNNTWELSSIPYLPVFDKIAEHLNRLKAAGVRHLQESWTLGGCPSLNLALAAWLMDEKGDVKEFLESQFGKETGQGLYVAQQKLSQAFSQYPFHVGTIYYGPQNAGCAAPFFLKKTGYQATMVLGYPYDDIERWASIYPADIYEGQYRRLCAGWREGVELFETYRNRDSQLDDLIRMAQAALCHFESAYHQICFVNRRGEDAREADESRKKELLGIIQDERTVVQTFISLKLQDSRIGYESANHYYYTLQDLKEKLINLAWCEKELRK